MDPIALLQSVPVLGPYLPAILAIAGLCAAIAALLPPPKQPSGAYYLLYTLINWVGVNLGHARNATAPTTDNVASATTKVSAIGLLAACLGAVLLTACATGQQALVGAGMPSSTAVTITNDLAVGGQLFCQEGPTLLAVLGINVKGASSSSVATACAVATAVGALTPPATPPVPVAGAPGLQATLATVPAAVAAVVAASKGT